MVFFWYNKRTDKTAKPEVIVMSNLTDTELDSMQNSEAAATYITESLFSSIFEIDGTADVMIL